MDRFWAALAGFVFRWRIPLVAGTLLVAGLAAFGLPRIELDTRQDTLVPASSTLYKDNVRYQTAFGGGEVVVLFTGDPLVLLQGENLQRLEQLHSELAENAYFVRAVSPDTVLVAAEAEVERRTAQALKEVPAIQARARAGARDKALAEGKSVADADAAGAAAASAAVDQYIKDQGEAAQEFANVGALKRDNPAFVKAVLFQADGVPRPEVKDLVPDSQHALLVVSVAGNMSVNDQEAAASEVQRLVREAGFEGVTTTLTGETLLLKAIADNLEDAIPQLAVVSILLMMVVVLTIFRARWRLLHLPVVFVALLMAFGFIGLLDLPLTLASTAGLPILVGLSVDFGIQFHTRHEEELDAGASAGQALARSLRNIGPALLTALFAACLGFAALRYSAVPMVRDFSIVLSMGIAVVFLCCLFALNGVLAHRDRNLGPREAVEPRPSFIERGLDATIRAIGGRPLPVLALGLAVAVAGFALDHRVEVQTEPEQFIAPGNQVLEDLAVVSEVTDTANQLNFLVTADDVTDAAVLRWMDQFQASALAADSRLTSAQSLATLFRQGLGGPREPQFSAAEMEDVYTNTPPDILGGFVNQDRREASITFTVRGDVKLIDQAEMIDRLEAQEVPPGVALAPAGLGVLGVEAETRLTSNRVEMTALAIAAALLLLFLVMRNLAHALVAMLPVVLVTGWTSAAMWAFGIPLNPLTAIAAPLVVALGTEFSILLLFRYREERARGNSPERAMAVAYQRSGRAITASALTVVGAFVALAFSDFPLLSDFGHVAVVGVLLSLAGAMLLMPPLLIWVDGVTWPWRQRAAMGDSEGG